MSTASRNVELQGSLAKFTLSDVVQLLSSSSRTGKLGLMESGSGRAGAIYFESGQVVHAEVPLGNGTMRTYVIMGADGPSPEPPIISTTTASSMRRD